MSFSMTGSQERESDMVDKKKKKSGKFRIMRSYTSSGKFGQSGREVLLALLYLWAYELWMGRAGEGLRAADPGIGGFSQTLHSSSRPLILSTAGPAAAQCVGSFPPLLPHQGTCIFFGIDDGTSRCRTKIYMRSMGKRDAHWQGLIWTHQFQADVQHLQCHRGKGSPEHSSSPAYVKPASSAPEEKKFMPTIAPFAPK